MTQSSTIPGSIQATTPRRAQRPRRISVVRAIVALMLREMSSTHGRSALGYLWAILEPVAGIFLLTFVFSLALRSPAIGTNFPLFYASGMLPFAAYMDTHQKMSVALRFSRQLLFYPGVTFMDALLARFFMVIITQIMVGVVVFTGIIVGYGVDVILDPPAIALGYAFAFSLGAGIGTLNCFLLSIYPLWERAWAILNRPLFILSCIFFLFESVPQPYQDWLWWNPLVHATGQVRAGIFATYDASYISPLYVFSVALITLAIGLLLLRRYHRDIVNL